MHAVTRLVGTLRTARHHRQPAGSVARVVVSPVLVRPARRAQRPPADDDLPDELDRFLVAVTFRIGRLGIPVVAEFTSPEPRTIVMRIVEGEGTGSVVETHATPIGTDPTGGREPPSSKPSSPTPTDRFALRHARRAD